MVTISVVMLCLLGVLLLFGGVVCTMAFLGSFNKEKNEELAAKLKEQSDLAGRPVSDEEIASDMRTARIISAILALVFIAAGCAIIVYAVAGK